MKIQILDRTKKKKFILGLEEFGLKKIHELLIRSGKEKIRAYSGNLSNNEIMDLWRILPIEGIGLYVGKDFLNRNGVREIRLSLDGLHIWKNRIIQKNFVLNEKQELEWFSGKNLELKEISKLKGFIAVKSSDGRDFIGIGKIGNGGKILLNFLPKERCRKN
tara:strand:- start:1039 stop:1524 length:486 start_codon:yes stop_codon:yes gene_type:complete